MNLCIVSFLSLVSPMSNPVTITTHLWLLTNDDYSDMMQCLLTYSMNTSHSFISHVGLQLSACKMHSKKYLVAKLIEAFKSDIVLVLSHLGLLRGLVDCHPRYSQDNSSDDYAQEYMCL